jgi:hypothetical protein
MGSECVAEPTLSGGVALSSGIAPSTSIQEAAMRAEAEKLADSVRQSLALLRRHL